MSLTNYSKRYRESEYRNIYLSRPLSIANVGKIVTILLLIVIGIRYHHFINPSTVAAFVNRHGAIAPFLFIILCGVKPVLFFLPTMGLSIVAGILFGPIWGMVYVAIGGAFSTAVGFYFARWLGRDAIKRLGNISKKIRQMDNWAHEHGKNSVLVMRFFNLPWDFVSYWAGLSGIKFKDFYVVSMILLIPMSFLYTYFGSKLLAPKGIGFFISLLIILTLGSIPFIKQRVMKKDKLKI